MTMIGWGGAPVLAAATAAAHDCCPCRPLLHWKCPLPERSVPIDRTRVHGKCHQRSRKGHYSSSPRSTPHHTPPWNTIHYHRLWCWLHIVAMQQCPAHSRKHVKLVTAVTSITGQVPRADSGVSDLWMSSERSEIYTHVSFGGTRQLPRSWMALGVICLFAVSPKRVSPVLNEKCENLQIVLMRLFAVSSQRKSVMFWKVCKLS